MLDARWNELSLVEQTRIAQALGYANAEALPPPEQLTDDQVLQVMNSGYVDEAIKLTLLRLECGTPDTPALEAPDVNLGDGSEIALLVMELNSKLADLMLKTAQEGIKSNKDSLKVQNEENLKKIQESIHKLAESKHSALISKIFGWIGVSLALVAAVAAMVVTGGLAAPAVAGLVIAAIGFGLMVAQETGGMQKLMDAMFGDNDKAKMIFMISLQVTMVILSLSSLLLSGGASAVGAMSNLAKIGNIIRGVSTGLGGMASIAGGASGIAAGVQGYDASQALADTKELQAWIAKLKALLEEEQENLKNALDQMLNGAQLAIDMLNGIAESKETILQQIGV